MFQGQYGYTLGASLQRDSQVLCALNNNQHVIPYAGTSDCPALSSSSQASGVPCHLATALVIKSEPAPQLDIGVTDHAAADRATAGSHVALNGRHMAATASSFDNPVDLSPPGRQDKCGGSSAVGAAGECHAPVVSEDYHHHPHHHGVRGHGQPFSFHPHTHSGVATQHLVSASQQLRK